jgi:uncharacterized cupredoxin-like copper-binding protein
MERLSVLGALFSVCIAISPLVNADDHPGHHVPFGKPGDPAKVGRSVRIEMSDAMRFVPNKIEVRKGETIRFVVKNSGQVVHEFVLGSARMLREHAVMMKKFPAMKHADPNQLTVAPGTTAELVWQFPRPGAVEFACLVPGHFEAGMRGAIAVR